MERCTECDLCKVSKTVVFGEGNTSAQIVSVGEAPGPDEDATGRPFVGQAGQLYNKLLEEVGLKRSELWTTNTAKCFPGRNAKGGINKPAPEHIQICTSIFLFEELNVIKPRVILAWGLVAAQTILKTSLSMGDLVGREFRSEWGVVIPLYHPSYFLRNSDDFMNRRKVVEGLQRAVHLIGGSTGTYIDQVKIEEAPSSEHHQEDKKVIAELEKRSGVFEYRPWREDREYLTGWSDGPNIVLCYKENGKKKFERVDDFAWYFYMKTDDVLALPQSFWSKWMKAKMIFGFEPDDVNPDWTKVFAYRHVVRTTALKEHLLESYVTVWDDRNIEKFPHDKALRVMLDEIEEYGFKHYEADLTPLRRFMTDYDIKLLGEFDEMYVDIETDDTEPLIDRNKLGERRILSIAWEINWADKKRKPESHFILLQKETDRAEAEMLEEFNEHLQNVDVVYAWNGNQFDFPILRHRMRRYRIEARWDLLQTIDLLRTWMRYFQRGATVNTSFSLQNIAAHVLKKNKIDWKARALERGLTINKFIELYRRAPDLLEEYNRDDAKKLVELEAFTGFAKIDQVFSRIGNCFARDYHITTKIDSLLLKRGKQAGIHFRTKKVRVMSENRKQALKEAAYGEGQSGYEGAYVLDPVIGLHENVAAVDFKSLYPSVMVAWNISPETYVPPADIKKYKPGQLIRCPTGAHFRNDTAGFVPTIFSDTGEKRRVYQKLQAEQPVGSDLFLLYYRLAYSFKRLGLSFYGDIGNVESRFFEPAVAEAVTLSGQYILKQAVEFAKREGLRPLYGDTDSIYIAMPPDKGTEFVERCNVYLKKHLADEFGVPESRFIVELEYENYFRRMFFVKKKRYAGLMTMYKGKDASFTEVKGLECMRSDGIEYARQMQKTIIEMIVRECRKPREIIGFLMHERTKALERKLTLDDVMITKGISKPPEAYKVPGPHVRVAKQYRDSGGEFFVGMKIPYVVVGSKPNITAVHAEQYAGTYDPEYYWDRVIYPPTIRILHAVYPHIDWQLMFASPKLQNKAVKHVEDDEDDDE